MWWQKWKGERNNKITESKTINFVTQRVTFSTSKWTLELQYEKETENP